MSNRLLSISNPFVQGTVTVENGTFPVAGVTVVAMMPLEARAAASCQKAELQLGRAVTEMVREFEPARLAKKEEIYRKHHKTIIESKQGEQRLAYRHALDALVWVLKSDFGLKVGLPIEQESTFVSAVGTEMGIEGCGPCAAK